MQEKTDNFFTETRKELEQYIQDRLLLLKLQATEKTARLVALLFVVLMISLLGFFVLIFLSVMAGVYFSTTTNNLYTGFGIVAGFYLVLLLVFVFCRKWISKQVINIVIRIFFDKNEER
ncbi:MAG: phage holin family protein [Sediminibacterium sp.]|nr:phage holin family protein [Sediminibacterium sp.]